MPKVVRPHTSLRIKTLAGRIRSAIVTAVDGDSITARIGTVKKAGEPITVIRDPERAGKFIEGTLFDPNTMPYIEKISDSSWLIRDKNVPLPIPTPRIFARVHIPIANPSFSGFYLESSSGKIGDSYPVMGAGFNGYTMDEDEIGTYRYRAVAQYWDYSTDPVKGVLKTVKSPWSPYIEMSYAPNKPYLGNFNSSGLTVNFDVITKQYDKRANISQIIITSTSGASNTYDFNPAQGTMVDENPTLSITEASAGSYSYTMQIISEGGTTTSDSYPYELTFNALALGGEVSVADGWVYHAFRSSGTFSVINTLGQPRLEVQVLCVAGGGAGGERYYYWSGRGGGAGGLVQGALLFDIGDHIVGVGAGGAYTGWEPSNGTQSLVVAQNSYGSDVIAAEGGGGGADPWGVFMGGNGGSGGGGGGLGIAGQGHDGGQGNGGGGGYSQKGQDGGANGSDGGRGTELFSDWGLATGTGENVNGLYHYAGGGAGVGYNEPYQGRGGDGGGSGSQRNGSGPYPSGFAGLQNTGGGGNSRGAGGSGVVILRYQLG